MRQSLPQDSPRETSKALRESNKHLHKGSYKEIAVYLAKLTTEQVSSFIMPGNFLT